MKTVISVFLILTVTASCSSPSPKTLVNTNFPFRLVDTIEVKETIEEIAVLDTWIGIATADKITGVDLDTFEPLWEIPFSVITYSEPGFRVVGDTLVAASSDQLILVDRFGNINKLDLNPKGKTIIHLSAAYPKYVYIIRAPKWILEVYDSDINVMVWAATVERGARDAYYDTSSNVAFVPTNNNGILAFDNSTGELLWKKNRSVLRSTFEKDVLYTFEEKSGRNNYSLAAFNVGTQVHLWEKEFVFAPTERVEYLSTMESMLIAGTGAGLIVLDKFSGNQLWHILDNDEFKTVPVQLGHLLFVKGLSQTIYAISPNNGTVIGSVECRGSKPIQKIGNLTTVHKLNDGLLFYCGESIYIFKARS